MNFEISAESFRVMADILPWFEFQMSDVLSFIDPYASTIYDEIQELNINLPNIQKWALTTSQLKDHMLIYRTGDRGPTYDNTVNYNIYCSLKDLRQIEFLKDYMTCHYLPTDKLDYCAVRENPLGVSPMDFRFLQNVLKFSCYDVLNRTMVQTLADITPENTTIALILCKTYKYNWETVSYCDRQPVFFRFLAIHTYRPSEEDRQLFFQKTVTKNAARR
jgi:hypothetical protein